MLLTANKVYDPRVHITAGQLRRLGFYLQEIIPDDAFVRRVAVGPHGTERLDDGSPTVALDVLEPFQESEQDNLCCVCI